MEINEFLLARLSEDEEACQAAPTDSEWIGGRLISFRTRLLAECEAKLRIVELHPEMLEWCQGCAHESYPCRTLLALALPYADHPDFRPEWRP